MDLENVKICVIGLGYVGLPLAHAFAEKYDVVGYDINPKRVKELNDGIDSTGELTSDQLRQVLPKFNPSLKNNKLTITNNIEDIKSSNVYIVTVPTPVNEHNIPDLTPLIKASETVGKVLKSGDIVVYESTVYPGCTEEDCVPVLERVSGLKCNEDFYVGYSPERINPGDKNHTVKKIKKVVAGSTQEVTDFLEKLYGSVIEAGIYKAPSIKVAEAAKVIENTQRDINIAFINELAMIFNKMGIDTDSVLEAASTKWNFIPFKPGLVGGHCIGVDPYYLAYKSQQIGHHPEIILAGRRINDNMGFYVAREVLKLMIKKSHTIKGSKVLILGITFKENVPDVRNTKVIDIVNELRDFGCNVDVYDPIANPEDVKKEYGIDLIQESRLSIENYDCIILAVAHSKFKELEARLESLKKNNNKLVIYDVKSFFDKKIVDKRL